MLLFFIVCLRYFFKAYGILIINFIKLIVSNNVTQTALIDTNNNPLKINTFCVYLIYNYLTFSIVASKYVVPYSASLHTPIITTQMSKFLVVAINYQ